MGFREYEIRLYDETLLSYAVGDDPLEGTIVTGLDLVTSDWQTLPPALSIDRSPASVEKWLSSRVVPKNRAFVDRLLSQVGLVPGDTFGIIDVSKGLSLNDSYWVVPAGFDGLWGDFNLYNNDFDEVLALVAYTGHTSSQRHKAGISSEWTTSGNYPKAWRRIDDQVLLYKGASPLFETAANGDHGPHSEYLASQVAEALDIPHAPYWLDVWKGRLASVCPLINDQDTALVPIWFACGVSSPPEIMAALAPLGEVPLRSYLDLLIFDALIVNTDRHAGNVSLLRDSHTGSYEGISPLYDHNLSLFPHDMEDDFARWPAVAGSMYPAGSRVSFDTLARSIVLDSHHKWCRRLLSFSFEDDPAHPLGPKRIDALSSLVRSRARALLEMAPRSFEDVRTLALERTSALDLDSMPLYAGTVAREGNDLLAEQERHARNVLEGPVAAERDGRKATDEPSI